MKRPRMIIYLDGAGSWRWTLQARNGRTIADGSEGYATKRNAERAALAVMTATGMAEIEVRERL